VGRCAPQWAEPSLSCGGGTLVEGDGMVHAITLGSGRASYRNRWVRTARFSAKGHQSTGEALAGPDNANACLNVASSHLVVI
jgi:carotenoid cleavage dioxygenase-like enzyme